MRGKKGKRKKRRKEKKKRRDKKKKVRTFNKAKNITAMLYYLLMIFVGVLLLLALLGFQIWQIGG